MNPAAPEGVLQASPTCRGEQLNIRFCARDKDRGGAKGLISARFHFQEDSVDLSDSSQWFHHFDAS